MKPTARIISTPLALLLLTALSGAQAPPEATFEFTPAQTTVKFTLDASFHTVHGTFDLKHGSVHFNPATGALSGEIVLGATSGHTGNSGRDNKMHKEILETARYPEIIFHPDHVEGTVSPQGSSTVQVHGIFNVHGSDHEMTVPVQVELAPDHWTATAHFVVPYIKWGIKDPSNFVLRVSKTVELDVRASGSGSAGAK